MLARYKTQHQAKTDRRGAAAVELAVCMPFLIALAFGMIEYNNSVMLKTRMLSAAYEAARYATRPVTSEADAATASQVIAYCDKLLIALSVNGYTVTVTPSSLTGVAPQTLVTVKVTAPFGQNSLTSIVLSSSTNVTASASLIME